MELINFNFEEQSLEDVMNKTLEDTILYDATDIHFDCKKNELIIKFRINGELVLYTTIPEKYKYYVINTAKALAGLSTAENNKFQHNTFTYYYNEQTYRIKASCMPINYGEKVVYHISSNDISIPYINGLGFTNNVTNEISSLIYNNTGIIIISGGRVSGKNTTLYSIIRSIDCEKNNVISIEKKIKLQLDGINQVQAKNKKISDVINDCLALDPNILIIDEIDNEETATAMMKAASNGILVITTMYSNSAYNTINSLNNMNIEGYLLSSAITGVISQRLVKRLCPNCARGRETTDYEKEIFKKYLGKNIEVIYEPQGCDQCFLGYNGRIPLAEVVILDEEIKKALTNKKDQKNLKKIIYENNETMIQNGLTRVINGETTFSEIVSTIDLNNETDKELEHLKTQFMPNTYNNAGQFEEYYEANELPQDLENQNYIVNQNNEGNGYIDVDTEEQPAYVEQQNPEEVTYEEQPIYEEPQNQEEVTYEEPQNQEEVPYEEQPINEEPQNQEEVTYEEQPINEEPQKQEEVTYEKQENTEIPVTKKEKNIPSNDNLSFNNGAMKNIDDQQTYDDFEYDANDMNAI